MARPSRPAQRKPGSSRTAGRSSATVRLNKYIADAGICSRRKADELIESGQVQVNGKKVYEHGVQVDKKNDKVVVSGRPILIAATTGAVYYLFNKPQNVVTTMEDPMGRPTVADFFSRSKKRIFPVGRLDWDTEGMLLMTSDGEFAQAVAHPKKEIGKTYLVKIDGAYDPKRINRLLKGVTIVGGRVAAKMIEPVKRGTSRKYSWVKIVITEGKNRQVRKMFEKIGYDVLKLQRIAIGDLKMGALKKGEYRKLTPKDLDRIFVEKDWDGSQKPKPKRKVSTKRTTR